MKTNVTNDSAIKGVFAEKCSKCGKYYPPENLTQTDSGKYCNDCMPRCVECHQHKMKEDGKDLKNGFVCNNCLAKSKRNKIIAIGAFVVCCIAAVVIWFHVNGKDKRATASGFDGVTEINDSVNIEIDSINVEFNLETATIASIPVSTQAPVNNIEDFKRILAQNVDAAKSDKTNSLNVPVTAVQFGFKSAVLSAEAYNFIREIVALYNQTSKENEIIVDGYACNIGEDAPNDYISRQRAEAVKAVLVENGVDAAKIQTRWYGKAKNSEFNLPKNADNRRVLISIE